MDLDALGNLGDFIGGIAVIVTLVYLANQIRQTPRRSARHGYTLSWRVLSPRKKGLSPQSGLLSSRAAAGKLSSN